jgi:CRISPR-associated endonuclease/helicase Cas3
MLTNKNSDLKKFHRFFNSIFIIDEYQSIPFRYNQALSYVLKRLAEDFNCKFLLMTATDPKWFSEKEAPYICQPQKYFETLDRVKMKVDLEEKTISNFVNEVANEIKQTNKSYLIILNTINSSKKVYQELTQLLDEEIAYLSTYVVPQERKQTIKDIRDKKYRIAVTTQLVEAGVDIDFDVVIRDLAPMDSINQAAGRCNRHGTSEQGEVRIVQLCTDDDKPSIFSKMVYGSINIKGKELVDLRLEETKKLLSQKKEWTEAEFLQNVEQYFTNLKKKSSTDISFSLIKSMKTLSYYSDTFNDIGITDFKLINVSRTNSLFIELNDEAKLLWNKFKEIFEDERKSTLEKNKEWLKIRSKFQNYVINVNVKQLHLPENECFGFYHVDGSSVDLFYDVNGYGYKNISEATII